MSIGLYPVAKANWGVHGSRYGIYASEVLAHAGLPFHTIAVENLAEELSSLSILLLPTYLKLTEEERAQIQRFTELGGILLGLGGTSGLDEVFGCQDSGAVAEAWLKSKSSGALHAFGGRRLTNLSAQARELGVWLDPEKWHAERGWADADVGPAIVANHFGQGWAMLIAADVMQSIVRIQQGRPVYVDGTPAPGAPIDDGILKTDDGIALDFERDRDIVGGVPVFARPITDEWRDLVIKAILWSARQAGIDMPMLWYWPNFVPAVGQISHDSDGNLQEKAEGLLACMQSIGIPSTWCIQYPGGYAPPFYGRITEIGSEVALHFDARSNLIGTNWREADLRRQFEWLQDMCQLPLVSNKNHYLRWEGQTEFFVWLERLGIKSDQTKGPTKKGVGGYPFGGGHPWFPLEEQTLRYIDVLEIPQQTWELVLRWPIAVGEAVVDQALAKGSVAHFLFHPGPVAQDPTVAAALTGIVDYGRQRGMLWWTNAMIQDWERRRRQVRITPDRSAEYTWRIEADCQLKQAAFLIFSPSAGSAPAQRSVQAFGLPAQLVVADVTPDEPLKF